MRQHDRHHHDRHRGFTLLELLLVLALVAAMVGLAWPALRGSLGGARLREAAKQIRIELSRTRLAAMESDAVYELQYSLTGSDFRVRRVMDLNPAEEGEEERCALPDPSDDSFAHETDPALDSALGWSQFNLPEGVVFADPAEIAAAELADEEASLVVEEFASVDSSSTANWSAPIVFYPDGTTTSAELALRNDRGELLVITLRGLTGVSQIADRAAPDRVVQ